MIHPVTEESEHPNHCTVRHLWVLAHQPGGNGEWIPNDLNSLPKIVAKERDTRRRDYVVKSSHTLVSTNRLRGNCRLSGIISYHITTWTFYRNRVTRTCQKCWKRKAPFWCMSWIFFSRIRSLYEATVGASLQMKNCKATHPIQVSGSLSNRMQVLEYLKLVVEGQLKIIKSKSIHQNHQIQVMKKYHPIINHQRWIKINKVINDPSPPRWQFPPPPHLSTRCQLQTPLWCSLNRYLPRFLGINHDKLILNTIGQDGIGRSCWGC